MQTKTIPKIIFIIPKCFLIKSNVFFNLSISNDEIINGIPKPKQYINIRTTPFTKLSLLAINNNADVKKVPTQGEILMEKHIPNKNALNMFRFSTLIFNFGSFAKNPTLKSPV